MSEHDVVIIGAGAAGLGAAHRFHEEGVRATIYEKCSFPGGHAASFSKNGFIFDDGPHISFTDDDRIRKLFHEGVDFQVEAFEADVNNYWKGHLIKHPAQVNLHGLPQDLVVTVINEMYEAKLSPRGEIRNYQDWLYASFGKTFSETFPMPYGKKIHTLDASLMDTDWIGPRLYQPDMEEVLRGALSQYTPDVHYIKKFYYPTHGGFVGFFSRFLEQAAVELSRKLVHIDPKAQKLRFADGSIAGYRGLVSSMPLPELIPIIEGVPDDVLQASMLLASSSCVVVNVGIDRADISEVHWTYFYDEEIEFARTSYPHMQSPNNVPDGCGSVQIEIYFSKKYKPLQKDPSEYIQPTINNLIECGIFTPDDTILFSEARLASYANVIFDLDRIACLATVHGYLDEIGIRYCGRFGDWDYHWTDGAFISGENAAQKILNQ
ncbi:MAG: FAD-dependent oxidoreductase [Pontiella sp.]